MWCVQACVLIPQFAGNCCKFSWLILEQLICNEWSPTIEMPTFSSLHSVNLSHHKFIRWIRFSSLLRKDFAISWFCNGILQVPYHDFRSIPSTVRQFYRGSTAHLTSVPGMIYFAMCRLLTNQTHVRWSWYCYVFYFILAKYVIVQLRYLWVNEWRWQCCFLFLELSPILDQRAYVAFSCLGVLWEN